jgi:hypothetical protein
VHLGIQSYQILLHQTWGAYDLPNTLLALIIPRSLFIDCRLIDIGARRGGWVKLFTLSIGLGLFLITIIPITIKGYIRQIFLDQFI